MIFLGEASNYRPGQVFRHLFAHGTRADFEKLRSALTKRYDATSVSLYHSGRSALAAAIAATVPAGSKVIVPGLTCIAVIRAVKAAGCTPVFCDITPDTLAYDPLMLDKIAEVCYNGGIIVQNTLGRAWELSKIEELAKKHHLVIIEDLAHSAGRHYPDGRETGTIGAAVALSFGKGKAIDTINGGAAILRRSTIQLEQPTQKPPVATRLRDRWYPFFGALIRLLWPLGLGKVLLAVLMRLHWIERSGDTALDRTRRLTYWQAKLALRQLDHLPDTPLRTYTFVSDRDRCLAELAQYGFYFSDLWYDAPVGPARLYPEADFPEADCPNTVRIAADIINFPTWYPAAKLAQAHEIVVKYEEEAK